MANSLGVSGIQGRADLIDPDHLRLNAAHHHFFKFSMKRMKILCTNVCENNPQVERVEYIFFCKHLQFDLRNQNVIAFIMFEF